MIWHQSTKRLEKLVRLQTRILSTRTAILPPIATSSTTDGSNCPRPKVYNCRCGHLLCYVVARVLHFSVFIIYTSSLYNIISYVNQQTLSILYREVSTCMHIIILESSLLYSNCLRCSGGGRITIFHMKLLFYDLLRSILTYKMVQESRLDIL